MSLAGLLDSETVPDVAGHEELDVRELPPPQPLQKTIERLEALDDDTLLVQVNDRTPQHLFPMLEERGYAYESAGEDPVYTAIWPA